jgi:DNA-binding transcriptional LysR family regulator
MKVRSLRMIEIFLTASRAGSFHAAAREIGVTQTAITKSIRELENTLKIRLFDRSVHGVKLTSFGTQFRRRAIQIEQQNAFLERELEEMVLGKAGCLRIGAGTVWSDVFLPMILANFSKSRSNVDFVIHRSVGSRFKSQLEEGEIDVGLGLEPSPEDLTSELIFDPITEIKTALMVRRDHPLCHCSNYKLQDLVTFPWAMYRLDTIIFERARRVFLAQGFMLSEPSYLADSSASVMSFVANTDHVTLLPEPMLPLAERNGLTALKMTDLPSFQSGAIYMAAAADYPLMQEFGHALKDFAAHTDVSRD